MRYRTQKIFFLFLCLLLLAVGLYSRRRLPLYQETRDVLGTFVILQVCDDDVDKQMVTKAYEEIWQSFNDIQGRMSAYSDSGDVYRINQAAQEPVNISADVYEIIEEAKNYTILTKGTFDITVKPLIRLWRTAAESNQMPTPQEINAVKELIGPDQLVLEKGIVKKKHKQVEIDLGAIAKGYAVDKAAKLFNKYQIKNYHINAGGDLYVQGKNCYRRPWRIGIRNPDRTGEFIDILKLSNAAVTTSGDYEQFYTIAGQTWSHIIDPRSGFPQKGVISATVIAPSAMEADALSTALTILSPGEGIKIIESLGQRYAAVIVEKQEDGTVKKTVSRFYKNFQ